MTLDTLLNQHKISETLRLILRRFTPDDFNAVCQILGNPKDMQYVGKGPRTKEEAFEEFMGFMNHWDKHGYGCGAIIHKVSGELIGIFKLYLNDRSPFTQLGYVIHNTYWGHGFGTEAAKATLAYGFDVLKLERIVAYAMPANLASDTILQKKLGMRFIKKIEYSQVEYNYYSISRPVPNT